MRRTAAALAVSLTLAMAAPIAALNPTPMRTPPDAAFAPLYAARAPGPTPYDPPVARRIADPIRRRPMPSMRPNQVVPRVHPKAISHHQDALGPIGDGVVSGRASWYCQQQRDSNEVIRQAERIRSACRVGYPDTAGVDAYAAAGPALRAGLGGTQASKAYQGRVVTVTSKATGQSIQVRLIDWCQCYWKQSNEKLIDLYHDVFYLIDATKGVTVSW